MVLLDDQSGRFRSTRRERFFFKHEGIKFKKTSVSLDFENFLLKENDQSALEISRRFSMEILETFHAPRRHLRFVIFPQWPIVHGT